MPKAKFQKGNLVGWDHDFIKSRQAYEDIPKIFGNGPFTVASTHGPHITLRDQLSRDVRNSTGDIHWFMQDFFLRIKI